MSSLAPVSPERHGARRWKRFSSYRFVQDHPLVPIVLGEETQVASALPILFRSGEERITPVALTRLGARTALVAGNGAWRGNYVPSLLRVYPFAAGRTRSGQFVLMVDEASGLLSDDPADPAFFDEQGQIAPELAQVVAFFRTRAQAETRTRAAMEALARTRILVPFTPPEDVTALPQEGLLAVDDAALASVGRVALGDLHRSGALGLVHAARVARHHLGFLAAAEAHPGRADAPDPAPPAADADAGLGGFFDALAASQAQEAGLADFMQGGGSAPPRGTT